MALRDGDKVRITKGRYTGTIGIWVRGGGVELPNGTHTGFCVEGVNVEAVPQGTKCQDVQDGKVVWRQR